VITTCEFVFTDRRVWFLSLIFFLMQLGWGTYIQSLPVILAVHFFFSPITISLFYAALGGAFLVMTLWLQPILLKKFSLKQLCFVGLGGMGLFFFISLFAGHQWVLWAAMILVAFSNCLAYTTMMSLFSGAVKADEQGRVMGGMGAIFGLTWALLAFFLGGLLQWSILLPLSLGTVGAFVSAVLILRYRTHEPTL
jgi:predicted MFS family arabinose efflux permease